MIGLYIFNVLLVLCSIHWSYQMDDVPPCRFEDTVDLSHAQLYPNGSYLYGEDIIIPPFQVFTYDYEILYDGERIPRDPHHRGCVCGAGERSCIKFCCHPTKEVIWNNTRQCGDLYQVPKFDHTIEVISSNGTRIRVDVEKEFTMVLGIPCDNAYPLDPEMKLHEKWDLFENGSLLIYYNLRLLTKRDFCIMPQPSRGSGDNGDWKLSPMVCPAYKQISASMLFNNVGKFLDMLVANGSNMRTEIKV